MEYVILLRPNHGPGQLFVSAHGGGWSEALNFPWTTNRVRFAKRFTSGREAYEWVQGRLPATHSYTIHALGTRYLPGIEE